MVTAIYSAIDAGMCNQFITHYVTRLLCLENGYSYRCGIQFVADGFPQLENRYEPAPSMAITLNRSTIRQTGSLLNYPFLSEKTYILSGMQGALKDVNFPGITRNPVSRRFHFNIQKGNITQFQFCFTHKNTLMDFEPSPELAQKLHRKMKVFQDDFLIGIHRRRTDYAIWNQGIYMDTDEQILEKIVFFRSVCGIRRPKFILCTDEPESAGALSEEPDVFLVNAEKEVEWLALQQTTFIIGAVSTFTFTAAGFKSIPYVFANEVITGAFQEYVRKGLACSL